MHIKIIHGDITCLKVDAIVNAANSSLMGGGGVDGAIHRAGGKRILEECMQIRNKQGGCPAGEAVITGAGNLPSKYVIHTVGPVWHGGNKGEPEKLRNCYVNSLRLAERYDIKTIAFPNISTGVYAYPKEAAADIAIQSIKRIVSTVEEVIFVCFDEENYEIYKRITALS